MLSQFQGNLGRWRFISVKDFVGQTSKVHMPNATSPSEIRFWVRISIRTKHHTPPLSVKTRFLGRTRIDSSCEVNVCQ